MVIQGFGGDEKKAHGGFQNAGDTVSCSGLMSTFTLRKFIELMDNALPLHVILQDSKLNLNWTLELRFKFSFVRILYNNRLRTGIIQ